MRDQEVLEKFVRRVADAISELRSELNGSSKQKVGAAKARIGRPRANYSQELLHFMRTKGLSWREIARQLGIGVTTARRAYKTRGE